jgi:hypothetical protein
MWPINRGIPLFAQSVQLNEADRSPFHPLRLSTERNLPSEEQCKNNPVWTLAPQNKVAA